MLNLQTNLPFDVPALERPQGDRLERSLAFMSAGIAAILDNLPVPRRSLSDSTKALHQEVTLLRRNGYCPCCQQVHVCDVQGKLPGAEFDHWYGRNRNAPDETWLICSACNRELENPSFKASVRSSFYSYQHAVLIMMVNTQPGLFE
jgi:hypothetical protein